MRSGALKQFFLAAVVDLQVAIGDGCAVVLAFAGAHSVEVAARGVIGLPGLFRADPQVVIVGVLVDDFLEVLQIERAADQAVATLLGEGEEPEQCEE